ncbi:MAG: hypothetical protein HZB55_05000 [Deltaproteobacteria bacterium]|nr:hypothetical protein [Deltaproteobacteria bacterium]
MTSLRGIVTALALCFLPAAAPAAPPGPPPPARPTPPTTTFRGGAGKVLETRQYEGYTYLRVKMGEKEVWAAGPQTTVARGDSVVLSPGITMTSFWSEAYHRSFDVIYFVSSIQVAGAKAVAAAPPTAGPLPKPEGGKTVEEIVLGREDLRGQVVVVRAHVSKAVTAILERNWLHLEDGTGGPGSNDLTVTTTDAAAVGDTVIVRGRVALDRDFGSGYRYDVMLEDAKVSKE